MAPGNQHDSRSFWKLYERTRDMDAECLIADAGYKTPAFLRALFQDNFIPVMPYTRPKTGKDLYTLNDFHYDPKENCYICPGG